MIYKQAILRWFIVLLVLAIVPLTMGNRGCWGQKMSEDKTVWVAASDTNSGSSDEGDGGGGGDNGGGDGGGDDGGGADTAWPVISNLSPDYDTINDIAVDDDYIYIAVYDESTGNSQWRIERRSKATGALVNGFGQGGVVVNNPSNFNDRANAIVADSSYLYIAGFDASPGDWQWRIEKRDKATGVLVNGFGQGGVVISNPTNSSDVADVIVADNNYIYIGGTENASGDPQGRIEKRLKTTGGQ